MIKGDILQRVVSHPGQLFSSSKSLAGGHAFDGVYKRLILLPRYLLSFQIQIKSRAHYMGSEEEERNCKVSFSPHDHTGDFLQDITNGCCRSP